MGDDHISININDLYRWSRELTGEALEKVRAEHGDDYYKMLYTAAYLFAAFAEKLQDGDIEVLDQGLN